MKRPQPGRGGKEAQLENHPTDVQEKASTAAAAEKGRERFDSSVTDSPGVLSKTGGLLATWGDVGAGAEMLRV